METSEDDGCELLTCWPPSPPVSSSARVSSSSTPDTCDSPDSSNQQETRSTMAKDIKIPGTDPVRGPVTTLKQAGGDLRCPSAAKRQRPMDSESERVRDFLSVVGEKEESPVKCVREVDQLASVALARWWRNTPLRTGQLRASLPESRNPHTILAAVQRSDHKYRLDVAQDFMRSRIKYLEKKLAFGKPTARLHAALGTFYEKIFDLPKAFQHLQKAAVLQPKDKEYCWHLQRVLRQLHVQTAQSVAGHLVASTGTSSAMKPPIQVERRSAESLSYEEFLTKYALTSTPVVITGLGDVITRQRWTLDHIRDIAGLCQVTTRRLVERSVEWARLEEGPTMTVADFIWATQHQEDATRHQEHATQHQEHAKELLYLFDWSLPQHCPKLAEELTIPKYFSGDYLQQTPPGSLYRESWPSLFIAPRGLRSELHVDAFGSNFWMALLSGCKRWVFFSQGDAPYLYPRYQDSFDPVFDLDLSNPDLEKYPLAQLAQPREVTLQEGELLFVPAGCPHRVENLTTSVAISANYVDVSNLPLVRRELSQQALVETRADDLLQQLDARQPFSMTSSAHLPWSDFKRQRRQTDDL